MCTACTDALCSSATPFVKPIRPDVNSMKRACLSRISAHADNPNHSVITIVRTKDTGLVARRPMKKGQLASEPGRMPAVLKSGRTIGRKAFAARRQTREVTARDRCSPQRSHAHHREGQCDTTTGKSHSNVLRIQEISFGYRDAYLSTLARDGDENSPRHPPNPAACRVTWVHHLSITDIWV